MTEPLRRSKFVPWATLAGSLLLTAIVLPLSLALYNSYLDEPLNLGTDDLLFNVPPGASLMLVAEELEQIGALPHANLLIVHARVADKTLIRAGEYRLEPGLTPRTLLEKLNSGAVQSHSITFPEGIRFSDMRRELEENRLLFADTQGMSDAELAELLGMDSELGETSLEGWFYPDTYVYVRGTRVSEILKLAHSRTVELLHHHWKERDTGLPLANPYEALILASLVEKETGVASERAEIAGVFVRRLQQDMKLQTDPTVIYALGESYDGNIRRTDLQHESPYNTYRYRGLPPTPIALVGEAALIAALHPADGDALYFVARGDGSHYFSDGLREHNNAVRRFQIENRSDSYRSAPLVQQQRQEQQP